MSSTLSSSSWGMDRLGKACQEGRCLCPDRKNPAPLARRRPDGLRQLCHWGNNLKRTRRQRGGPLCYLVNGPPPSANSLSSKAKNELHNLCGRESSALPNWERRTQQCVRIVEPGSRVSMTLCDIWSLKRKCKLYKPVCACTSRRHACFLERRNVIVTTEAAEGRRTQEAGINIQHTPEIRKTGKN